MKIMKISPHLIKKELEQKRLAEEEALREIRLKERLRKSKFNSLMTRCLEAAVAGNNEVDLGYEFYDLKNIEEQILDKWIDIDYLSENDYLIKKISEKLSSNTDKQFVAIYGLVNRAIKEIIACLNELSPYVNAYENIYFEYTLSQVLLAQREFDLDLSKCIFYILQAKDAFNVLVFDFEAIPTSDLKEDLQISKSDAKKYFQQLSSPYENLIPKQEGALKKSHAIYLKWDKKYAKHSTNHSTSDYLDGYSLTYLASPEGQSFVDKLKKEVEESMVNNHYSLPLTLLVNESFNSIKIINNEEIRTVYSSSALEGLLRRFGYKVEKQLSGEEECNYLISWKN
jgi:hypothetical protein